MSVGEQRRSGFPLLRKALNKLFEEELIRVRKKLREQEELVEVARHAALNASTFIPGQVTRLRRKHALARAVATKLTHALNELLERRAELQAAEFVRADPKLVLE